MSELFDLINAWDYKTDDKKLISSSKNILNEWEVALSVNGNLWLNFCTSPCDLSQLAIGFLFNESIIKGLDEIEDVKVDTDYHVLKVKLRKPINISNNLLRTSTGLGISPKGRKNLLPSSSSTYTAGTIASLYDQFLASRPTNNESVGGLHCAALSDGSKINLLIEDIGRHNCIDKLAGYWLSSGKSFIPQILILTGRISSEMVQKSLAMNIHVLVSRTTPTIKAIELAKVTGVTVIGYVRQGNFSVFSHPEVIVEF